MATLRKSLRTIKIQPLYYFKLIKYERTSYKSKFITEWGSLSRLYKNFLLLSADCPQKSRRFVRRVPLKYAILKAQNKKARLLMAGRQFPKQMIRWGGRWNATAATATCGGNRALLLGQWPTRRERRSGVKRMSGATTRVHFAWKPPDGRRSWPE